MLSLDKLRTGKFSNWAGNENARQLNLFEPRKVEDLSEIIRLTIQEQQTVRTVGAGHSFSPVVNPESNLLTLHHMRGLKSVDVEKKQATFWAGTYLFEVGPVLANYGLALENMGDIAEQSIAGAISTGTHGTGVELTSISNQVVGWGFVDGLGNYHYIERNEDQITQALHISLGLFGVVVEVTFQALPLYALSYASNHISIEETLLNAQTIIAENRHAEWFYFPGQQKMQLKTMNKIDHPMMQTSVFQKWSDDFMENNVLQLVSTCCKLVPKSTKLFSKLSANGVPVGKKEEYCYDIFPSPRKVKFVEMEYAIPLEYFEEALEEIHFVLKSNPFQVHFPIEIRVAKGETGFLSPTQGQDSVFFAFHMYKGMKYENYFKWAHQLMEKYGARPHLGKMNQLTTADLYEKYAGITSFLDLREVYDPHGVFLTSYYNNLFAR